MACNGSKMLTRMSLPVFLEITYATTKKKIIKTIPKTAYTIVFCTALALTTSVISSNSKAIFTNLFNAGVHLLRISSTPCC